MENEYLKNDKISGILQAFQDQYSQKMKHLNAAYKKIFDILIENNINPNILNTMHFRMVTDTHFFHDIITKGYQFSILAQLMPPKKEPYLIFKVKNTKSLKILEENMGIYKLECKLPGTMTLILRNVFSEYYVI